MASTEPKKVRKKCSEVEFEICYRSKVDRVFGMCFLKTIIKEKKHLAQYVHPFRRD